MKKGKVKFWHDEKGYAFIVDDADGKEYYTYKKYLAEGVVRLIGNLEKGIIEVVEFELKETRNGFHAINVKPINN